MHRNVHFRIKYEITNAFGRFSAIQVYHEVAKFPNYGTITSDFGDFDCLCANGEPPYFYLRAKSLKYDISIMFSDPILAIGLWSTIYQSSSHSRQAKMG